MLKFLQEDDYDKIDCGDELELSDIKSAILNHTPIILKNKTKNLEIPLVQDLSLRDREMLIDGGLLNYTKNRA